MNPVVSLKMVYPRLPPDPFVEAFQANVMLLVVVATTWKLPGVLGGVDTFLELPKAGKESMATVIPSATALAAALQFLGLLTLTCDRIVLVANIIDPPFGCFCWFWLDFLRAYT